MVSVLGLVGIPHVFVALVALPVVIVGLQRIRWRNTTLTYTFWAVIALLVLELANIAGLRAGLLHLLVLALLHSGVAIGLATGARECLAGGGADETDRKMTHLRMARALVIVTFLSTLISVLVADTMFRPPTLSLLLIAILSLAANLWLGVILVQLREHPTLQEHSTGRS
jgi:hypothetical protein